MCVELCVMQVARVIKSDLSLVSRLDVLECVQKTLGVVGKTEAKFYKPRPEAEVCRIAEVFSLSTEGRSPRYLGDPPTPNGF